MKLKKNQGHVVYSPLSAVFQVQAMGGAAVQKYDATTGSYIPNRLATPMVLQPSLILSDPDGIVNTADYVRQMTGVVWTLTVTNGSTVSTLPASTADGVNFSIDSTTKCLRLYYNVQPTEVLHIKFFGQYVDKRRNEVLEYVWERDFSCEVQTDMNVSLDTGRWRGSVLLSPMKKWGQFGIPVQLKNGKDDIPDEKCTYQWQWWDESSRSWSEDFSDRAWLVSGEQTKQIIVDQDYIQSVVLRVRAVAYGNNATTQYWTTRMRRWYGQFDYDVEFLRGKYVFHDFDTVAMEAWVANAKGIISNPSKYFDIELFFAQGDGDFESVGYGTEAVVTKSNLQSGQPKAGVLCRELSAYRAICDSDGNPLCMDDGSVLFVQIPTKSRDV